jgi:phospholipid/cholesterol/gamma-HCH transport system ATP-binding protein
MIALEHGTVRLDGQTVLDDVSFQLEKGEMLLVIGPPEGGKTMLVRALAGLVPLSRGSVRFDGNPVDLKSQDALAQWQRRVGVAFQNDALFDSSTAFQNVRFPLEQRGVADDEADDRVKQRLTDVGLWDARDKLPGELSGGMRKRCGIARAVITEPVLGLFDDPTAGLDPLSSARILDLIVSMRRELDMHTVVVSNELAVALPIATRVLMLHKGKALYDGSPADIEACDEPHVHQFVRGEDEGPL